MATSVPRNRSEDMENAGGRQAGWAPLPTRKTYKDRGGMLQ